MRKSYLIATAAGLLLALGGAAQAGHLGGPPPGFSTNPTGHGGFETFSGGPSSTAPKAWDSTTQVPGGWDQGKADWKVPDSSTTFNPPPGLLGK